MPGFGESPGLKRVDPTQVLGLRIPVAGESVVRERKPRSGDNSFLESLQTMKASPPTQLPVSGPGHPASLSVDFGGLAADLGLAETGVSRDLQEARRLIQEGRCREALTPIASALRQSPGHHEAIFLKAFCQNALDEPEPALVTLDPLRRDPTVKKRLGSQARKLREEIRGRLTQQVLLEFFMMIQTDQLGRAVGRLDGLIALDPEAVFFHYLRAGALMMTKQNGQALEGVDAGLAACRASDRSLLEGIRGQIVGSLARERMAPARAEFRRKRYAQAQAQLGRLDPDVRATPLCVTFVGYLEALEAASRVRSPGATSPPGSFEDADRLYFFLVEDEMARIKQLAQVGRFEEAAPVCAEAHALVPGFPYLCFLYGNVTYCNLVGQLQSGKPPDIDVLLAGLKHARGLIQSAGVDPEIEGVQERLEEIGGLTRQLEAVRQEIEAAQREAKPVNEAMQEFDAVIALAKGGITSADHWRQVHGRMVALRGRLPALARQVTSTQGKQAVADLTQAVERSVGQLEAMQADIEESPSVEALYARLQAQTDAIQRAGGIRSPSQAQRARADLRTLTSEAELLRARLRGQGSRKHADELIGILTDLLNRLG